MNIHIENVSMQSSTGPNSFARKLYKYLSIRGHSFDYTEHPDVIISFIQSYGERKTPTVLRLDGIYFNTLQDYEFLNKRIKESYHKADGVIIQSEFDKELIFRYFGEHPNVEVIHNGADIELISTLEPLKNTLTDSHSNLWCCAASWRPHKRLSDNVRYFMEHSDPEDCLVVAGKVEENEKIKYNNVYYMGDLNYEPLLRLYKSSKYFIHLSWLDHCPNVVVDAKSAGCKLICSSAGGTVELAGKGDIIVEEDKWGFEPVELYRPPPMNFSKKTVKKDDNLCYDMKEVAKKYENFLKEVQNE